MQLIGYKLPWQPNHHIVSDFFKKEHNLFKANYLRITQGQIDYFCTYYETRTWLSLTNELFKFMLS